MMLSVGLTLGARPTEKRERRRARRRLLGALAFNLVVLPALAVALTHAVHASDEVAVALLLLAVAPGGRFLPQLAGLAHATSTWRSSSRWISAGSSP
jgi:predicted Na+-dependent transporter